ncbi:chitin deacetylase 1-like isoform X2 [Pollicipes pollicipes]|uniref:chitin deacetylase 1-like isoform X2 n=1 Tax=Pollicipes pollicipes TaxID=41117 RepID=UPI001884CC74|nr:chitin deacetylase 1-like isoform X2 [Pollicipes pollicipes]
MRLLCIVALAVVLADASSLRQKRQLIRKKENNNIEELCKDRGDEFFRLETDGDCKEVYRCTRAGLKRIQCPDGLAFDVRQQTCLWKRHVKTCDLLSKPKKVLPLLKTDEPLCPTGQLACGNSECLDRELFCDGNLDCTDDSDENACEVGVDPNGAGVCEPADCALPECFCSPDGTQIPGALEPAQTPQMITITFHGSVNVDNIGIFQDIFRDDRQNPNGCTAKGTFYVSHKYTNYSAVQELHRKGHEIGVFSITNEDDPDYWSSGTFETWYDEMAGARDIIERFANITDGSVTGVRAPQLRVGGNNQFFMMEEYGFLYDSSITAPLGRVPIWPYTLDYRMPHKCLGTSQNCPSQSHRIWEMVINELDLREDRNVDERLPGCHLLSSCTSIQSSEQFAQMLRSNFDRHYTTNRAPLGLHFTAGWLSGNKNFKKELNKFIDEMQAKNDVYFVSNLQVLSWMNSPTESNGIRDFAEWKDKCDVKGLPLCSLPNPCPLTTRELPGENFYLNTCMECPKNYPWVEDYTGNGFAL